MEPYRLDQLPPVSPDAHELATTIRTALRDRELQRRRARECGEEVHIAVIVQQWASSLARWIKSRDQRDRETVRRAVARCNEVVARREADRSGSRGAVLACF
jgi:hypothetical protein